MLPCYPGWFSATFSGTIFLSVGAPPVGNGGLVVFWLVLALGTKRISGRGRKTRKHNFPVLGALWGGKYGRPNSFSPKLPNFLHFPLWPTGAPGGGKSQNRKIEKLFTTICTMHLPGSSWYQKMHGFWGFNSVYSNQLFVNVWEYQ